MTEAGGSGAGTLWATAAVMFAGALLTGLPAVWWTRPDAEVAAAAGSGGTARGRGAGVLKFVQSLLQGAGARALTAGLMLGSGLGVVVPEGFFAFVEGAPQDGEGLGEWAAGAALVAGFAGMLVLQLVLDGWTAGSSSSGSSSSTGLDKKRAVAAGDKLGSDGAASAVTGATAPAAMELSRRRAAAELAADGGDLGLAVAVADPAGGGSALGGTGSSSSSSTTGGRSPELALGGLLVHSAADGLAVGAASLGGGLALSLTVAAAIMAHKLPVTWGLSAFLRAAGWSRRRAAQGLLAFAASAPVAALITFYVLGAALGLDGGGSSSGGSSGTQQQYVALAVLFSGGTFLAAATQHILPAALQPPGSGSGAHGHGHGHDEFHGHGEFGSSSGGGGGGARGYTPRGSEDEAAVRLLLEADEAGGGAGGVAAGSSSSDAAGGTHGGSSRGDGSGGVSALLLLALGAVLPLFISALLPEAD